MEGKFITFEGIDGSGKTSVLKGVIEHLNDKRIDNYIWTREPGGNRISEAIRKIILNVEYTDVSQYDWSLKCKMVKHLSDIPYVINNLCVSLGDYAYDDLSKIHSFTTIVYIDNQMPCPQSITIETERGTFTSKVISRIATVEINEIILKKNK